MTTTKECAAYININNNNNTVITTLQTKSTPSDKLTSSSQATFLRADQRSIGGFGSTTAACGRLAARLLPLGGPPASPGCQAEAFGHGQGRDGPSGTATGARGWDPSTGHLLGDAAARCLQPGGPGAAREVVEKVFLKQFVGGLAARTSP
ncbi:hypothetical protein EYF80_054981 [Liparis tanakae]|uniref:Uncharacterized protein n=1 Tax=Liparis tanakae TaxID=230148 RepID=A0A4Z2F145_9TELE|nr:hypothetical protein EYF80_054981 [Liparis tanakae]